MVCTARAESPGEIAPARRYWMLRPPPTAGSLAETVARWEPDRVSPVRGKPREVLPIRGGTGPADVAVLHRALAARLRQRGLTAGDAPAAGTATPQPLSLLVPVAPQDEQQVRGDLRRRLGPVPPGTDLILRTSGSTTGTGRLVAMSAAALVASARATHTRLGGAGQWVLALPSHHVAGLQVLVRSILAARSPVVVDTTEGFVPEALADAVERAVHDAAGAPVYTSLVPTQLADVLASGDERPVRSLARAAGVLLGGAATDPDLLRRARDAGIRAVTTYGMSETAGGCVYDGVPLDGVTARLEGAGPDGVGRIVLSGPMLAEGYVESDAAPSRPVRAEQIRENNAGRCRFRTVGRDCGEADQAPTSRRNGPTTEAGRAAAAGSRRSRRRELVTADRGRIDADGRLEVLGRIDDLVITGGVKVDPRQVEEELAALPGVAQACVLGLPDARWGNVVVAVVVPAPGVSLDAEDLRVQARQRLGGVRAPKRVELVESLPLRGPGKIDRRAVAERLRPRSAVGSRGAAGREP